MISAAQHNLAGTGGEVVHSALEDWEFPSQAFDLVVSRLALHYLADLDTLCVNVHDSLVPGGRFICSVEHPVITSCNRGWPEGTLRQDWVVDDYFDTGLRVTSWMGGVVRKYHRTVEDYFATFQRAGFTVEQLRESRPQPEHFADLATYERRKRIPLFLFLAGRKSDH
jgi:SAM-dependent methyltransferase